ncbi:MAG TPA: hypothetical protein DDZ51_29085 [Planctomycetaceae bacterium]|nr:hypothetical protein [Planctomycetaceae bacterium]
MNQVAIEQFPQSHHDAEESISALRLPGLDGTNPLGFLAALGLFRILSSDPQSDRVRMRWVSFGGTWVPELTGGQLTPQALMNRLSECLLAEGEHIAIGLFEDLGAKEPSARRNAIIERSVSASHKDREAASWLAAVSSDAVSSEAINQLQTVRRDYFIGNIRSVVERTTASHLERALFHAWDYADPLDNQSLHLDPTEDRRHAHQWNKPSGDPSRKSQGGMLGANRLALEAIPIFTSIPDGENLKTIGFTGRRSSDTRWTWPIWSIPVDFGTMQSLLCREELQQIVPSDVDRAKLRAIGVVSAFRTYRILVGKTPNFTPPKRIA